MCSSEALGWRTTDIILTQLAARRSTSFWVTTGVPSALPPSLINLLHQLVVIRTPLMMVWKQGRSRGEGGGWWWGVASFVSGLLRVKGSWQVGGEPPVKPCYPLWSQLWANNSSNAPDIETRGFDKSSKFDRMKRLCRCEQINWTLWFNKVSVSAHPSISPVYLIELFCLPHLINLICPHSPWENRFSFMTNKRMTHCLNLDGWIFYPKHSLNCCLYATFSVSWYLQSAVRHGGTGGTRAADDLLCEICLWMCDIHVRLMELVQHVQRERVVVWLITDDRGWKRS